MKRYRISEKAFLDLENIWQYTNHKWSKEQADRYYSLMIAEIEYISHHPDSGRDMHHIKAGYKVTKVKSHLIFYREGHDGLMEIIRILHEMMDIPNKL
ncbi:type II toxin-antitoxin system RelE/ParE family toxin [Flavobacterium sp. RHBU_3]|uniref:type II toxin-antitoxin system RelE/ParE family toxin n=1 Tax=Flavobacterium sp. RHBU_3 TaxID=3391184 RepID=UPI0039849B5B